MLEFKEKKITYDYSQCQQCGVCEAVCPKQAITMSFLENGTHTVSIDEEKCIKCQKCVRCCPSNKTSNNEAYLEGMPNKLYFLAYNKDNAVRRASSSGGTCKTLIINSLKQGLVDGVYTLRKLATYPSGEGAFFTKDNIPSYDELANSVYHSVMIGSNIDKVQKCDRLMIVGTSCQLRALEVALKGKYKELIKVCIFCKQQKTLESTRFLAKVMGTTVPKNLNFSTRYRGEGWPGIVRVREAELPYSRAAQLPFGRRLWTVPGCNVCGDPFGMESGADISLMDPWCIRSTNDLGETLVTVHSENGLELIKNCKDLVVEPKSYQEIKPALGELDVWRKRSLVPYFRGENCSKDIQKAGKAEMFQRKFLMSLVETLPALPIFFYRVIFKFPDLRNIHLKQK